MKKYIILTLFTISFVLKAFSTGSNDTLFVSGNVSDAVTQLPLQGVRIQVENFSSALTDENGKYRIRIPFATSLLNVSSTGYITRNIPTQGLIDINIKLYSDMFTSPDKAEGAFQKTDVLSTDDELKYRFSSDIRVVKRSGQQGIGSNLYIRGYNSLNVSASPLIVIDGVVRDEVSDLNTIQQGYFNNPLLDIDPNDIASVSIIKNANSIYGSKGANGAIIINTLRGKSETTKITFDASSGYISRPQFIPVMNAGEYRTFITDVLKNSGYTQTQISKLAFLQDDRTSLNYNKYHNDTNWGDVVYGNGTTSRYAVNVQGGDEIALYAFSVAYNGLNDVLKGTNMNRLSTRFNSDIKLTKSFYIGTSISFSQIDRELRDDGMDARTAPGYIALVKSPLFHPYKYTTTTGVLTDKPETVDDLGVSNPLSIIEKGIGMYKQYRFGMNIQPQWQISKNLKFSSLTSYNINKMKEHYFIPVNGVASVVIQNRGISYNVVKDQVMQQISVFSDNKLTYDKTIGKQHKINASAGYRFQTNRLISDYGEGHNTGGDYVSNLIASLAYKKVAGLNDQWTSGSVYAQATYNYLQRYTVWSSVSADNSSRFGADANGLNLFGTKWAVFPSVGAEWLVTGESFMKHLKFIDRLNVHADYGLTGNDNIGNNDRFAYLQSVNYIDKAVGLQLANLDNSRLQWETTRKLDGGIDLSLFGEKLTLGASVFDFYTSNLLTRKSNSIASGLGSYWANSGELKNTGYELSAGIKLLETKSVKWNLTATVAHYQNTITALPEGNYTTAVCNAEILTAIGNPAGVFYGYKALGVIASTEEADALHLLKQNANGSYTQFMAGDIHFEDISGPAGVADGIINEYDKQVIGNPNPDVTGSVFSTLAVKDLTLDVVLSYSVGNDIYNYQRSQLEGMSNYYNQSTAVLNRWIANGQVTDIPAAVYGDPMGNARFSSRWIEDGSYLKLQNVKLSYKLPLKVRFLNGVTIWVSGSNLLTFTKYLGTDPENSMSNSVLLQGIDAGLLPSARTYNAGIKVNL